MGTESTPDPGRGKSPKRSTGLRKPSATPPPPRGWRTLVDDGLLSAGEGLGNRIKGAYRDVADDRAERVADEQRRFGRTLFIGTSRDDGRTARVILYADRVERIRTRSISSLVGALQDNEVTPVKAISSVQVRKENLLWSVVTVYAASNAITFRMSHNEARSFRDNLMKLVLRSSTGEVSASPAALPAPATTPEPTPRVEPTARPEPATAPDALDQLRRLGELRELGVVSDEEFAAKKAELLKRV